MSYLRVLAPAAAVFCLLSAPAFGYMDPGSGSLLLQIILGGLAGLAVAGKLFWHRLTSLFRPQRQEPESDPGAADTEDS